MAAVANNAEGAATGIDRRRMLLVSGLTAAGVAAGGVTTLAAAADQGIRFVVSDRRLPESLVFAEVVERAGARRLEATDGLTRLWQDVLRPHWQSGHGATVGLTTVAMWQVLAEQARGEGRQARLIGRHRTDDGGSGAHRFAVPSELSADAGTVTSTPGAWPAAAAHLVSRCAGIHRHAGAAPACGTLSAAEASFPALVSWRIG
ncbi:hypothetical protein HNO88_001995 [Novosphingobium chloroacetimidivorans]|uniref:Uncharacterized protein n=1 Tax=Novosphingobium chloroacetimidivorans TaxID=1428314 RepID=A0A7W7KAF3_9SPHN|nr:hypothetical protein [Novosphingobium chloroacetimidivorans]MBB4858669.1 hypothetical protein [Novosphingobium chloroacetimidivorans]